MRNFYDILGVSKTATEDEIKKAYRRQSIKWHPDRHAQESEEKQKQAEEKFKDIASAYETLSDAQKRAAYDTYGEGGPKFPQHAHPHMNVGDAPPRGGSVPFVFTSGPGVGGMSREHAEEIFNTFFSGASPFMQMPMGNFAMMGDEQPGFGGFGDSFPGMVSTGARVTRAQSTKLLPKGTVVRLIDLKSAPHRNTIGRVQSFDYGRKRYNVNLEDGNTISVKPSNLRQLILDRAKIVNTSRSALNGKLATSAEYDKRTKRYRVDGVTPDGKSIGLKPENIILPKSTRVSVSGVVSRPGLNGMHGIIIGIDDEDTATPRYTVKLESNEKLRLKYGNCVAC